MASPRFASALSTLSGPSRAEEEATRVLLERLGDTSPDLLLVFVNHHFGDVLDGLGRRLKRATGAQVLMGCTGMAIAGDGREVEEGPALALWAAALPGVTLRPVHVLAEQTAGNWAFSGLPEVQDPTAAQLLLLGDPFSFPMGPYLERLGHDLPGLRAVGGMASGGRGPGQNLLFLGEVILPMGALGLVLEGGDIQVETVVSQGCRPIGTPYVITACEQNVVTKLGGKGAAQEMLRMLEGLDERDRDLFRKGPFLGLAVDATKSRFEAGDLLARGISGMNPKQNSLAVGDSSLRVGQTVHFQVRDAESASEDLARLLEGEGARAAGDAAAALLFTCGGRGKRLFGRPDHDVAALHNAHEPSLPIAGFFAAGEIGPIGGQNFLHGFTAAIALFRQRGAAG